MRECNLETVISLPAGIFMPYTMAKTDILIFEKVKSTKSVWFYVLENDGFELATKRKKIREEKETKGKQKRKKWKPEGDMGKWKRDRRKVKGEEKKEEKKEKKKRKKKKERKTEGDKKEEKKEN